MAERGDLDAAADAGVIAREQVGPLADFLASRHAPGPAASGEEDLRFIRNFHDVFLAIGIVLFALGMAVGIGVTVGGWSDRNGVVLSGILCAAAAGVMWGLGELFARRRRLFLPAIATVCSFTLFAAVAVLALYFGLVVERDPGNAAGNLQSASPEVSAGLLLAASMLTLAPLAFYLRFRLPFSMGMIGAGLAFFAVVAALLWNFERAVDWLPALYLVAGLLLFGAGVAFDARDPARQTRLSDNGFWLHFAAAPLLLNGAFGLTAEAFGGAAALVARPYEPGAAVVTLIVVLVLGIVSLLINRRALIVSALITTGVAIAVLMRATDLGEGALAASTLLVLGAFVLILGAGWHTVRRALLARVKPDGVWARIFPPETSAA